eukprot:PITA_08743
MTSRRVDYSSRDSPYRLDEKPRDEYSPDIARKRSKVERHNNRIIQSQERLARVQEKQEEVNVVILLSLRSERGYFPNEFKIAKPATFDGELKKIEDAEVWLLGMKKFFVLHDYRKNIKFGIVIFSIKGKEDIWWDEVKLDKAIKTEELSWHEFKRLFKKKYLLEIYYDGKAKEFYELKMRPMTDEEYMTKFLELLIYVPDLKYEKMKVQRLISELSLALKDQIKENEPRSLEEFIGKLKHCYE